MCIMMLIKVLSKWLENAGKKYLKQNNQTEFQFCGYKFKSSKALRIHTTNAHTDYHRKHIVEWQNYTYESVTHQPNLMTDSDRTHSDSEVQVKK